MKLLILLLALTGCGSGTPSTPKPSPTPEPVGSVTDIQIGQTACRFDGGYLYFDCGVLSTEPLSPKVQVTKKTKKPKKPVDASPCFAEEC